MKIHGLLIIYTFSSVCFLPIKHLGPIESEVFFSLKKAKKKGTMTQIKLNRHHWSGSTQKGSHCDEIHPAFESNKIIKIHPSHVGPIKNFFLFYFVLSFPFRFFLHPFILLYLTHQSFQPIICNLQSSKANKLFVLEARPEPFSTTVQVSPPPIPYRHVIYECSLNFFNVW